MATPTTPKVTQAPSSLSFACVERHEKAITLVLLALTIGGVAAGIILNGEFSTLVNNPLWAVYGAGGMLLLGGLAYLAHQKNSKKLFALVTLVALAALVITFNYSSLIHAEHLNLIGYGIGAAGALMLGLHALRVGCRAPKSVVVEEEVVEPKVVEPVAVPPSASPVKETEFDMIKRLADGIDNWKEFHNGEAQSRTVELGTTPAGEKIFKKSPTMEHHHANSLSDELGFLISKHLNLNCVPITMCVRDDQPGKVLYVLQEGIDVAEKDAKPSQANRQRALFYNIITGRLDGDKTNSLLGADGTLYEIDNEVIGVEGITDSWLFEEEIEFDPAVTAELLALTEADLVRAFTELRSHQGGLSKKQREDISRIKTNFRTLQTMLKGSEGTFAKLKEKFYRPDIGEDNDADGADA